MLEVVKAKGKLSVPEYLRLRVRYFVDGAVLGNRNFVNDLSHRRESGLAQSAKMVRVHSSICRRQVVCPPGSESQCGGMKD
jgi:hypothetical protein